MTDRSSPLQGGLRPDSAAGEVVLEVACDESGFSGSNLLDPATPVFTHASVDLGADEAAALVDEVRSGLRRFPDEFKSGHVLRGGRSAEAASWFLAALGERAHVLLVDKEYFLVTRMVDLFLGDPTYACGTRLSAAGRPAARALHRARGGAGQSWGRVLATFLELLRATRRHRAEAGAVDRFLDAADEVARQPVGTEAAQILRGLDRQRVLEMVDRLAHDDRTIPPPLEPMLPALAETVRHWSRNGDRVLVVHDEQSALTADRLRRVQRVLAEDSPSRANPATATPAGATPLVGLVVVDSREDPRVQAADLLAGVARRVVTDGAEDLLGGLVSPASLHDRA